MAVEAARGCGHRVVGGMYLVGPPHGRECCRLPSPIVPCEMCGHSIEVQMRGITRENPNLLMAGSKPTCLDGMAEMGLPPNCPMVTPGAYYGEKVALMWVGQESYSPESFAKEASEMGVSKRIPAVPRGWDFQSPPWVFLAHPDAVARGYRHRWRVFRTRSKWSEWAPCTDPLSIEGGGPSGLHGVTAEMTKACLQWNKTEADVRWQHEQVTVPGIFLVFKPTAIELIVTKDTLKTRRVRKLARLGVKLIEVPVGDPDHDPKGAKRLERQRKKVMRETGTALSAQPSSVLPPPSGTTVVDAATTAVDLTQEAPGPMKRRPSDLLDTKW